MYGFISYWNEKQFSVCVTGGYETQLLTHNCSARYASIYTGTGGTHCKTGAFTFGWLNYFFNAGQRFECGTVVGAGYQCLQTILMPHMYPEPADIPVGSALMSDYVNDPSIGYFGNTTTLGYVVARQYIGNGLVGWNLTVNGNVPANDYFYINVPATGCSCRTIVPPPTIAPSRHPTIAPSLHPTSAPSIKPPPLVTPPLPPKKGDGNGTPPLPLNKKGGGIKGNTKKSVGKENQNGRVLRRNVGVLGDMNE